MKITINKFGGNFDGEKCYVHARATSVNEEYLFMTMQYLNVAGADSFLPLKYLEYNGTGWSEPRALDTEKKHKNGYISLLSDATPIYHPQTEKIIIYGYIATYEQDGITSVDTEKNQVGYYVFDPKTKSISELKYVEIAEEYERGIIVCCSQSVVEDNGDILMPVELLLKKEFHLSAAVARLSFDGEKIRCLSISNILENPVPRGVYEGSLIKFKKRYFLTMRNDNYGYFSVSDDGENFSDPQIWRWDSGDILENYNTQQHWFYLGDDLYLVYTRKAENNDHVFRHRAPLFAAKVDIEKMCLIKETEEIVVPERGARLGNFGANQITENKALVTVGEWMQFDGRKKYGEQYGSDNSIFYTLIEKN